MSGLQHKYSMELVVGQDDINFSMLKNLRKAKISQMNSLVRNVNPVKDLRALLLLYRLIKSGRYDIVHTFTAKSGILGRFAARLANTPTVIHGLQGSTFHPLQNPLIRQLFVSLERLAGRFTDCFVCVGNDLKKRYLDHKIGTEQNFTIIHTGQNLEEFIQSGNQPADKIAAKRQELGLTSSDIVIGKVGRLAPVKGHIYCIRAAERLIRVDDRVKFLFAGDGPNRSVLESEVRKRNLEKHIIFAGFRKDIAEIMATFDIMAHTSLLEGLPHVFVQACAVGKPIVTFAIEGANDMVDEGENGYVVPIGDVDALVQKLAILISSPEEARKMGAKSRERIDDSWKIENMVQSADRLYQNFMSKKGLVDA